MTQKLAWKLLYIIVKNLSEVKRMIGVLLVTHGNVCESLKESMEMILGQQKNFCALSLNPEDDVMELKNRGNGSGRRSDRFGGSLWWKPL